MWALHSPQLNWDLLPRIPRMQDRALGTPTNTPALPHSSSWKPIGSAREVRMTCSVQQPCTLSKKTESQIFHSIQHRPLSSRDPGRAPQPLCSCVIHPLTPEANTTLGKPRAGNHARSSGLLDCMLHTSPALSACFTLPHGASSIPG